MKKDLVYLAPETGILEVHAEILITSYDNTVTFNGMNPEEAW